MSSSSGENDGCDNSGHVDLVRNEGFEWNWSLDSGSKREFVKEVELVGWL